MIKITISRTKLGSIQSFKMTGHADYAPHGQILSVLELQRCVWFHKCCGRTLCNASIELGSDGGFLTYELPNDLDVHTAEKSTDTFRRIGCFA